MRAKYEPFYQPGGWADRSIGIVFVFESHTGKPNDFEIAVALLWPLQEAGSSCAVLF